MHDNESYTNLNLELEAASTSPLDEVKMLIVGDRRSGKTALVQQLVGDVTASGTEGINITRWPISINGKGTLVNVWDFGSQEINDKTYRFFLTNGSLYILVLDARAGESPGPIEYWTNEIQKFGGESRVLVVLNKSDQHELELDWIALRRKYPIINDPAIKVSCSTGFGIPELRSLVKREVARSDQMGRLLPTHWLQVKAKLEETDENYISYGTYKEKCQQEGIAGESGQRALASILHETGTVLHFQDPLLEDTNVLKPRWVTRAVSQILNSTDLFQNKGILRTDSLADILKPAHAYPSNKFLFITGLMRKFDLCFDFPGYANERFLIPQVLDKQEPDSGRWDGSLAFEYHYIDELPESVIFNFIAGMQFYISQNTVWREGTVLVSEDGQNRSHVTADIIHRKISIHVDGIEDGRRRFLEIIRSQFARIHKITSIGVQEKVPVPGHPDVAVDYLYLLTLKGKCITTFIPEGLEEEVNVEQLLEGIDPEEERGEQARPIEGRIVSWVRRHKPVTIVVTLISVVASILTILSVLDVLQ